MYFEEFCNEIIRTIEANFSTEREDMKITLRRVLKNNGLELTGLVIGSENSNINPTIYLNSFYERYQSEEISFNDIAAEIMQIYRNTKCEGRFNLQLLFNKDYILSKVMPRLINAESNTEFLETRPHVTIEDLAVTYYIVLDENAKGLSSIAITNELLKAYGLSVEELHQIAVQNMQTQSESTLEDMNEVIEKILTSQIDEESDIDLFEESILHEPCMMYVLSNRKKMYGAAAILDSDFMDRVAHKIEKNFYILPSSVHEQIIVPATDAIKLHELELMVSEVNETQVAKEDMLSNHVYIYDYDRHCICRADHVYA